MAAIPCGAGLPPAASAVTSFAGDAPHGISDHSSRPASSADRWAGRWRASGTASTSRCTPIRCWSWARNTPGRSRTKDDLKRPYRALLPDADHGEGTNLRPNRRPFFGGDSRLAGHEEWFASGHACAVINSIDFLSGACHSSRRFWQRRSQVTIVRDRDTRRAGPVPAAFLFAPQSRRATPPRWREHRGLKTP